MGPGFILIILYEEGSVLSPSLTLADLVCIREVLSVSACVSCYELGTHIGPLSGDFLSHSSFGLLVGSRTICVQPSISFPLFPIP